MWPNKLLLVIVFQQDLFNFCHSQFHLAHKCRQKQGIIGQNFDLKFQVITEKNCENQGVAFLFCIHMALWEGFFLDFFVVCSKSNIS